MTLLRMRQNMMKDIIKEMIDDFIGYMAGEDIQRKRHCATCGRIFVPRTRNHFFHTTECRKVFYAGQFVIRERD